MSSGGPYEIIWANRTDLFDADGDVKYVEGRNYTLDEQGKKRMTDEEEQTIIYGNGPITY
jgi:hypothetical protein